MSDIYVRPDGKNRFQIRSAANGKLPSVWLDQEFNRIYGYLNGLTTNITQNVSEWAKIAGTYTYQSATVFTVSGDMTNVFQSGRAIQFTDSGNTTYNSYIKSSSYNSGTGITTINVYDSIIPSTISSVAVGFLSSDATALPSVNIATKAANYTVGAKDEVIFVDDTNAASQTSVYDDGQINGSSYPALLITLPTASDLSGKLLCVKKIAGTYQTIISSTFTHSTSTNADNDIIHTNTYNFQIYGDTAAKNRITLKGIGDCYYFVSNGTNWYELTPEASETVKGIVRLATKEEMTLTAQQIADGEELKKDLAVSPYHLDQAYLRTDARNMKFASNFIYQAPNGVAAIVNNNIVVYEGLGLNVPNGRNDDGILKETQVELDSDLSYSPIEVSDKVKLMFVTESKTLQPVLASNYFMGYKHPTSSDITATLGDTILWFDFGANLIKQSTDNGSNWTTWAGAGPICEYYGNGANITNITPYAQVGFLTRDDLGYIERKPMFKKIYWSGSQSATLTLPTPILVENRLLYVRYTAIARTYVDLVPLSVIQNGDYIGQINRGGENADRDYDNVAQITISDGYLTVLTPTSQGMTFLEIGVIS